MKLNKNYIQTFIFILVYLFAIYYWTQPLQDRKLPYGEYDAMSHFMIADYIAYNDKSFVKLPHHIDARYGRDNRFRPHTLWYPPTFHTSLAIAEVSGGERVVPVFFMNAILATFVIVTVYFVVNSLFGFLPAILSALLIIFSPRDFMPFLWGQWPERFAYAFVPIILYCFYKYLTSYSKESSNPVYLYLTAIFLGANFLIHPLVMFHSLAGIFVLYAFLAIKQKKIVFNWRHTSIAIILFLILFFMFPYQTLNIFPQLGFQKSEQKIETKFDFSRIFKWSLNPKDYAGSVPPSYFSYREMHGLWTLPFLLIGILFLVLRRESRDIFLLAWLVSLYFVLHRDFIGQISFLHRSLSASAHIFAPLTALGTIYLSSTLKLQSNYNKYLKYAFAGIFIYFVFSVNMVYASAILNKNTYNPNPINGRLSADYLKILTGHQLEAAQWILDNTLPGYNLSVLGIPHQSELLSTTAYKIRWLAAASQRATRFYLLVENKTEAEKLIKNNYVVFDYEMPSVMGDAETINKMQSIESTELKTRKLLYEKNMIRVYEFERK